MGLLSFLKRTSGDSPQAAPLTESVDSVQQARTRARQRLIGAVVLVVLGVIGFSLLFETQPRPVAVDVPIEIARREGGSGPATPAPSSSRRAAPEPAPTRSEVITEAPADTGREVVPSLAPVASAPRAEPARPREAPAAPETRRAEARTPAASAPTRANEAARAQALLEGRDAPAASAGRFVVQVGAFAETGAAREARQKVEKLGLKTYTQVVETSGGNRIRVRVGPFASRDEADRAAGKIKSAGLPSSVLTL